MLNEVAAGVALWQGQGGPGEPNATVIIDDDGLTVVDALVSPTQAAPLADACNQLGLPVRRLVVSSSHIEFVGGSKMFPLAAVYGTPQISAHLDQAPNIDGCRRLFPSHAGEFEDLATRPVSHMVTEPAWISATAVAVPLGGELDQNLAVQVPEVGVVVCGALAAFGTIPLLFDGDPAALADSLDVVAGYGHTFVPGHGPAGGLEQLRELQAYLRACAGAQGDPSAVGDGPWREWAGQEYHTINVERAALLGRGDHNPPPSMLRLLGLD